MIGQRFGPYEIVAKLGAGGMGEVYRARDARLGRDVAIKILPDEFSTDAGRLARFDREAHALAALSHPNIAAIYGVETINNRPGLILELVDGPTLAEIIAASSGRNSGNVLLTETLAIARQVAEALEAAHDRGIVHRDLKPANVKVTPQGLVKVLDFGLAKSRDASAASASTRTADLTQDGFAVGTPRYMSPEQARGLDVGPQTDVWSFGCVFFELLTGRPAFDGQTITDTLAAVISGSPDWNLLPTATPPGIRRLLRRCLQRELRARLRHIGDACLEISEAAQTEESASQSGGSRSGQRPIEYRRLTDSTGLKELPAISPDGKMVAFTKAVAGKQQLWIQLVEGGVPLQVTRDPIDHLEPRWTPDSSKLIYFVPAHRAGQSGSLWEVSALGGVPRRIAAASTGGDVSREGSSLAFIRLLEDCHQLVITSRDGSNSRVVATFPRDGRSCSSPRWSPDSRQIAFAQEHYGSFETRVFVVSADGGEPFSVARADWIRGHTWRPDGSGLVYSASTGTAMPYPPTYSLRTVDRDGRNDRELTFGDVSYLEPDVQTHGRMVVARARSRSDVWMVPVDGTPLENTQRAQRLTRQTGQVQVPTVSPDGTEFCYVSDHGGHSNLWIGSFDGTAVRQVTFERDPETIIGVAHWSPQGDRLVFIGARRGRIDLQIVATDGSEPRLLCEGAHSACWSGDGRWLYCVRFAGKICKIDVGTGTVNEVRTGSCPAISRDGSVLYFATPVREDRSGTRPGWEVRRASPEDGPSQPIVFIDAERQPYSQRFGPHAHLSPDGEWLTLPLADGETTNLWILPTSGGAPRPVTDYEDRPTLIVRWVSWAPDGRHLVAAVAETDVDVVTIDGLI